MIYRWNRQAEDELLRIIAYCTVEFGKAVAKDFLDNLNK